MFQNAREWLPDWFMALNAVIFFVVPLLATRIPSTRHKSQKGTWKLLAVAFSQSWFLFLFVTQGLDMPFIESNVELRLFLGRIGFLAIGYAECIYVLNGLVFDIFRGIHLFLLSCWQRLLKQWKSHFSSLRSS